MWRSNSPQAIAEIWTQHRGYGRRPTHKSKKRWPVRLCDSMVISVCHTVAAEHGVRQGLSLPSQLLEQLLLFAGSNATSYLPYLVPQFMSQFQNLSLALASVQLILCCCLKCIIRLIACSIDSIEWFRKACLCRGKLRDMLLHCQIQTTGQSSMRI